MLLLFVLFLNNHIFFTFIFLISWFTWVSLFNNEFSPVLYYVSLFFWIHQFMSFFTCDLMLSCCVLNNAFSFYYRWWFWWWWCCLCRRRFLLLLLMLRLLWCSHTHILHLTFQTVPVMVGFRLLIWIACRWLRDFVCECGFGGGE